MEKWTLGATLSFPEFVQAVAENVGARGFPYPNRDCYIWINERQRIAELWHDTHNTRAELQLHKMNDEHLLVAHFALTEQGVKDAAFSINDYFLKV